VKSRSESAALGFRVKSGWAAAVLLAGPACSPRLCDSRMIYLCDPRFPETRQPYHAAMGKLEENIGKIRPRLRIVHRIARQSIANLFTAHRRNGYSVRSAALVVGSQINPASIANPHIRAHALEGQLFRSTLEQALRAHRIRTMVLTERNAYAEAAAQLEKSVGQLRHTIDNLGSSAKGPWRAEQKLAALAAWLALRR